MMITHTMKLLSLIVPLALAGAGFESHLASAQPASEQNVTAQRTVIATIQNMLPVDGCSYPVTIGDVQYAPDPGSLEAIRDRVPAGGTLRLQIRYHLTGRTAQVACGFGATQQLPEISFQVLRVFADGALESDAPGV